MKTITSEMVVAYILLDRTTLKDMQRYHAKGIFTVRQQAGSTWWIEDSYLSEVQAGRKRLQAGPPRTAGRK
jgi:hypothetical protein